jgi:phage terminase large subunit-like protein
MSVVRAGVPANGMGGTKGKRPRGRHAPPGSGEENFGPKPFTLEHFRAWAADLTLDNGRRWHLEPFQAAFIADVFAGYVECWLIVPEGNTKTTTIAGLALYHLEHTPDAWVPVGAASRDQARIVYRQAAGFVRRTPRLAAIFRCYDGYRRIHHRANGAQIEIFAADADTADGVIPTLCLVDEPHRQKDLSLYQTWSGKLDKRGGQIIAISIAGEPGSEFERTRERMRQQATDIRRDGSFGRFASATSILHEWALPEGADPEDMTAVKATNPFSGIDLDALRQKRDRPTMTLQHWLRFVCNVPSRGGSAAITELEWFAAQVDDQIPFGEPIDVGLDVAWKWDTTAAVPLWIRDEHYRLFGRCKVLIPPRDGNSLDPAKVEQAVIEIHERNPIRTVVMDTTRAEQLGMWIESELGAEVLDTSQGIPVQVQEYERFMEALRNGWIKHVGDPDLTQHALNAIARVQRGGDAVFERPVQSRRNRDEQDRRVIDALKAAAMVHRVAAANFKPKKPRKPRRLHTY